MRYSADITLFYGYTVSKNYMYRPTV